MTAWWSSIQIHSSSIHTCLTGTTAFYQCSFISVFIIIY